MKSTNYSDKLKQERSLAALAQSATQVLEEALGQSACLVDAEWDQTEDERGRSLLVLRISDWTGSASMVFTAHELKDHQQLRVRLYRLWGDLLQVRSHKQLEKLLATSGESED